MKSVAPAAAVPRRAGRRRRRRRGGSHRVHLPLGEYGPARDLIGGELGQQVLGDPHEEQLGDAFDEKRAHPGGHLVRAGLAVVHVQYDDGDHHGQSYQHHGEEDVLTEQWQCERGRRDDLGYEEEEHGLGQQYVDAQGYFLSGVGGEVEDEDR